MNKKIIVFREEEGSLQTAQTEGMVRKELVTTPGAWVGMVSTESGFVSGWHHHGDYETFIYVVSGEIKMEFGKDGEGKLPRKTGRGALRSERDRASGVQPEQ